MLAIAEVKVVTGSFWLTPICSFLGVIWAAAVELGGNGIY